MQKRAVLVLLLISLLTLIQDVNAQEICNDGIDNDADGYTDCWDYYGTPSECPPDVSCLKASPMCSTSTNKWECPIEFGFFTHVYDYVFDSITYPCVAPLFSHYKADLDEFLVDTQTTPNARIVAFDMPSWSFGPNWFTSDPANGFGADYYFLTAPWYGTFLPGHDDIGDLYDEAIDYANSKGFTVLLAVPFAPSYGVQNQLDSVLKQEFYEFMLHLLNDRGYKNKDIIWHFAVEADIGNFHPDPQRYLCSTQEYINWITDMMQEAKRALNDVGSTQKITPAISMNTASMQTLYSLGYTFVCDPADTRSGEVRGLNFYGGTDCDSYNQASCLDCGPTSTNKGVACVSDIIGIDIGAGSETIINSFADTFGKDVGIWQALLPPPNPTQTQVNQLVDGIYNSKADYMVYYEMRDQDFFDGVCDSISGSDDPEGLKYWNGVKKISYDSMIAKFNQYSSCQNIVTSPTTVYGGGTTTGTVTACCPDLTYCAFNGNCIPRYDSDAGTEACGFDVDSDGDKELCGFGNTFYDQDNYADSLICTECGNTWNGLSGEANCFGDDAIEVTGYSRQTACNQDYSAETNTNCPRTFTGIDCGTNDYPSFSSDTSDTASCTGAGDCVYSSTCYNDNTKQIINGENLFCNNNKWWDFDNRKLACEAQDLCGTYIIGQSRLWKWTKAGEVVGEYDDTVNPECCGDDPNEKFILGSDGTNACCNSATDIVTNGICFEMDPDLSSTECTDGSYNWISRGSQANCCGDDAKEYFVTGADLTTACCSRSPSAILGLVAEYHLDETSGAVIDSSGNAHDGTNYGATRGTTGVQNYAYSFDGVNDYINLANPSTLPSGYAPRTMCAWGKTNSVVSGWRWIAAYGTASTGNAMFIGMNGATLYGGGYDNDVTYPNFWTTGTWKHVCLTYDGTTAKLYGNGVLLNSMAKSWNLNPSVAYIGRQVNNFEYWNGVIDEVRIYNKALTGAEVYEIYSLTTITETVEGGRCKLNKGPSTAAGYEDNQIYSTNSGITWIEYTAGSGLSIGVRVNDCYRWRSWMDFNIPDIRDSAYIDKLKLTFAVSWSDNRNSRPISIRGINNGAGMPTNTLASEIANSNKEYASYIAPYCLHTSTSFCPGKTTFDSKKIEVLEFTDATDDLKNALTTDSFSLGYIMPDESCILLPASTYAYLSLDSSRGTDPPYLTISYNHCRDEDTDCNICINAGEKDAYGNAWLNSQTWPWPVNPTTVTQGDVSHAYYNWVNNIESCL